MKNSKMKLIEVVSVSEATLLIGGMDLANMPTDNDNVEDHRGDYSNNYDHNDGNFGGQGSNTDGKGDKESPSGSTQAFGRAQARRRRRARASLTLF
jgi:hypothetical protein